MASNTNVSQFPLLNSPTWAHITRHETKKKAREPKRIDSVADPDDDDANEDDIAPSTSMKKNDWDIVSLNRK